MGYNTEFRGELKFTSELTASQLAAVKKICGEDCRDHPEWNADGLSYIDLCLADGFDGLKWDDGCEKTYDLDKLVNVVIAQMRKRWPDFGLSGTLFAQGESVGDIWQLTIGGDGFAHRLDIDLQNIAKVNKTLATGEIIEMGNLDDGGIGIVLDLGFCRHMTLSGFTEGEMKEYFHGKFGQRIKIIIESDGK